MKPAPLLLKGYFVNQMSFTVNLEHDPAQPTELTFEDINVESDCQKAVQTADVQGEGPAWQTRVLITQNLPPEKNAPYNYAVELVGLFQVAKGYPEEKCDRLVKTNGRSMLYGLAREVIRNLTSQGPFPPMLIPTVSFYEPEDEPLAGSQSRVAEDSAEYKTGD